MKRAQYIISCHVLSCHVIPHLQCCTLSCLILSYTMSRTTPPPPLLHSVTSPPPLHHITSFPPLLHTILPVSASPFSPNAYTQLIVHPPATNVTRHPCIPHNSPSLSIRLINLTPTSIPISLNNTFSSLYFSLPSFLSPPLSLPFSPFLSPSFLSHVFFLSLFPSAVFTAETESQFLSKVFDDSIDFIAYQELMKAERRAALAKADSEGQGASPAVLHVIPPPSRNDVVTDKGLYERAVAVMNPTRCSTRSVLKGTVLHCTVLYCTVLYCPCSSYSFSPPKLSLSSSLPLILS
jgi:hypothetical protein